MIVKANEAASRPIRFRKENTPPDLRYEGRWRRWPLPFGDFKGVALERAIEDPAATAWLKEKWVRGYLQGGSFAYVDALLQAHDPEFRDRCFWDAEQAAYNRECCKRGLPEGAVNPHRPLSALDPDSETAALHRVLAGVIEGVPLTGRDQALAIFCLEARLRSLQG